MRRIIFGVLAALTFSTMAAAETRVIDGDTLELDGTKYRLFGIDAPEMLQRCGPNSVEMGVAAKGRLMILLQRAGDDAKVECEKMGHDKYGRTIGLCKVNGVDLQEEMVRAGFAFAYPKYSAAYVEVEKQAIAQNVGVHRQQCEKPWDWREEHKH